MRKAGERAIITLDDLDALVEGNTVTLPEGAVKLVLHSDVVEYLEAQIYGEEE